MAEFGRAAFTIVGSFFGPWGTLIGSFLGSLLFPVEGPKGPRLQELNVQHSTVGSPIPIVYGTAALAGNIIWSGGLIETEGEGEGGGKGGGGGAPTTYSYSVDVAIGICEGPITGVRRIWADADLIYDASSDTDLRARLLSQDPEVVEDALHDFNRQFAEWLLGIRAISARLNFELYLGTEDQLPDPTIQSYENVGYVTNVVPAYRGLAYIVFPAFQLEKFGNRIPNFRFEVFTSGAEAECGIYSAGHLEPWEFMAGRLPRVYDPRNPDNEHLYGYSEGGQNANFSFTTALATMNAANDHPQAPFLAGEIPQEGQSDYIHGWSNTTTPNYINPCDTDNPLNQSPFLDYVGLEMTLNVAPMNATGDACIEDLPSGDCAGWWSFLGGKYRVKHISSGNPTGLFVAADIGDYPENAFEGVQQTSGDVNLVLSSCSVDGNAFNVWSCGTHELGVRRLHRPKDTWQYTWTPVSGTFKVLQKYTQAACVGPYVTSHTCVTKYPVDPCLPTTSPFYNSQAFWESAYADALAEIAAGAKGYSGVEEGWVYGVDYPVVISSPGTPGIQVYRSDCTAVATDCVPMATIVADICRRAGLRTDTSSQIDVSDLTTCVHGYIIGRQMSARDALGPLRMFGLWDAVESDALLKFVERGHALVTTLTTDDLGAYENGSEPPSLVEVTRTQEKELPRRLRLHFPNFKFDHEASEQFASRITTEAIDELDVELAVSMEPDTAKQLAEIMLYEAWVSRNRYRLSLDNDWLALEPTDCIEIPVDGQTERVRIVSVDYSIGGILKIDAVRDDDGAYVSTAVATPGTPSGGVPGSSGLICPAEVVLLDIPRLRDQDTDAGYYAAIYSTCDSWTCAELYRSADGGATYQRIARTDLETTVGEILAITGPDTDPVLPGDSPAYDAGNSITVNLFEGALSSVTDDQIAVGQNLAAIGRHGRWVIIQFKTATLDTGDQWTLTDIIWGINDTQHLLGTTVASDTFVLLTDSGLLRIPESPTNIGIQQFFKIVACGESIDAVTAFDFTTWGLSYQRPCTAVVLSCSLAEPPVSPADGDAYLLPNDTSLSGVWANHDGEIATWSDETDSWVYCTPVPGTVIHCGDEDVDVIPPGGGDPPLPAPWIIQWQDEGVALGTANTVNFVGAGVVADRDSSGLLTVFIPGGLDSSDSSTFGFPNATYITEQDESADLPNSLRLVEGANITFDVDTSNTLTIHSTGGSSIPLNTQTGNYTLVIGDAGYCIYRDTGSAATWTIPANGSVAFPIGTVVMFNNQDADTNITLAITTDTLIYSPSGATGSRTLLPNGRAFAHKVTSTSWVLSGTGIN